MMHSVEGLSAPVRQITLLCLESVIVPGTYTFGWLCGSFLLGSKSLAAKIKAASACLLLVPFAHFSRILLAMTGNWGERGRNCLVAYGIGWTAEEMEVDYTSLCHSRQACLTAGTKNSQHAIVYRLDLQSSIDIRRLFSNCFRYSLSKNH